MFNKNSLLLLLLIFFNSPLMAKAQSLQTVCDWHQLKPSQTLDKHELSFFKFKTENGSLASLVVLNLKDKDLIVKPFFNEKTDTTSDTARKYKALAAVNGGYFNLSDSESASHVVIDGNGQCDPKTNKALVQNPKLKPYLSAIFNRSELRILKDKKGHYKLEITRHEDPLPTDYDLESSLQAGPQLLPELTAESEAFIRKNPDGSKFDSIGANRHAARTACGITPDNRLMLLCVASMGQAEFSSGVTLSELADTLKKLGCDQAINFDGGTSTTMVISNWGQDHYETKQVCGRTPEKLIKSGLMILAN